MTRGMEKVLSSLRGTATLHTLAQRAKPRERHQLANRYARLENERARLEREIGVWENRRQTATNQLANVRKEIDSLRPLLAEAPERKAVGRSGRGQRRGPALTDAPGSPPALGRTMQLEY